MAGTPLPVLPRRFGATMRRDAWWVQPAIVFLVLSAFIVYATWAAFQGNHYTYGPYLSPFYSPELFGDSPHAWFGPKPGWWPAWLVVLAGAPDPAVSRALPGHLLLLPRRLLQGVLGRSAVVRRRRAAEALPGRGLVPADRAERPSLLPLYRAALPGVPAARRLEGALVHRSRDRADVVRHRRGNAGARDQRRPARRLHVRLPLACATWSAATSTGSPVIRCAASPTTARAASTARTCGGRGAASSPSRFADIYVRLCSMGVWTDWRIL